MNNGHGDEIVTFMAEAQEKLSEREKLLKILNANPIEKTHSDSTKQQENEVPKEVQKKVLKEVIVSQKLDNTISSQIDTTPSKSVRELRATFECVSHSADEPKPKTPKLTYSAYEPKLKTPKASYLAKEPKDTWAADEPKNLKFTYSANEPKTPKATYSTDELKDTYSADEPRPKTPKVTYSTDESKTPKATYLADEPKILNFTYSTNEPNTPKVTYSTDEPKDTYSADEPRPKTPKVTYSADEPKTPKTSHLAKEPKDTWAADEPKPKTSKVTYSADESQSPPLTCTTPVRLVDEINEVYEVHARSLPRATKVITDYNDSNLLSLKEYRREMMEKSVSNALTTELITETDACDSSSTQNPLSKKRIDQLHNLIAVCTAQYDQAKKALRYTMDKPERDEVEFIEANHILLTHRAALESAIRMRDSLERRQPQESPRMKCAFTFNSVTFELNAEFLHEVCLDGSSCYFTVVIAHNETSRCSPHISYRANNKCRLTVDIYSVIGDVKPGFEIYVEIYMLKIRKTNAEKRNTFAEVVGTLLRNDRHDFRSHEHRPSESRFERVGVAVINSSNMRSHFIAAESVDPVAPRFEVNFDHHLIESDYHMEGYLRRFELLAGVGNWAMEYMTFNNWFLESWITNREKQEKKPSIRSINLRHCLSISEIEDSASYPFSFMLTYNTEENKNEKLTLAARSKEEYDRWFKCFNEFVNGLQYWS